MSRQSSVLTQAPVEVERRRSAFSVRNILRSVAPEVPATRRNTDLSSSTLYETGIIDAPISNRVPEPQHRLSDNSLLPVGEKALLDTSQLLIEAARTSQQFAVSSPDVYQHHGRKKLKPWFGKPWEVRVPDILEQKWTEVGGIKERLDLDLEPTRIQLTRKASKRKCRRSEREFNAELRMSGVLDPSRPNIVTLLPHVWIFCGSDWALKAVQKAIKSISWIEGFLNRPVEFCIGGVELCALDTIIPLEQLQKYALSDSSLGYNGGYILYHIAKLHPLYTSPSACGWLCCATYMKNNKISSQRLSRIGGILTSDILGGDRKRHDGSVLTVAHGLFNDYESDEEEFDSSCNASDSSELESDSEVDSEEEINDDKRKIGDDTSISEDQLGVTKISEVVTEWIPFDVVYGINCFGKMVQNQQHPENSSNNISDYALLRSGALRLLHNMYKNSFAAHADCGYEIISTYAPNSELIDGKVALLLGMGEVEEAWLLPGFSTTHLEGKQVTVRRLQLRVPLAHGTSGTWVVKGSSWYGMIIAAYVGEPLAVFITAEDILSDIGCSFPESKDQTHDAVLSNKKAMVSTRKSTWSTEEQDRRHSSFSLRANARRLSNHYDSSRYQSNTDSAKVSGVSIPTMSRVRNLKNNVSGSRLKDNVNRRLKNGISKVSTSNQQPFNTQPNYPTSPIHEHHHQNTTAFPVTKDGRSIGMDQTALVSQLKKKVEFLPLPWPSPTKPVPAPPPTTSLPRKPVPSQDHLFTGSLDETSQIFHLSSTPYSIVAPKFRHGNIPLTKSLFSNGQVNMVDTLDWTAYQVAILCSDEQDSFDSNENVQEVAEDLGNWFDSFGFESHGGLVHEPRQSESEASDRSLSDCLTGQPPPRKNCDAPDDDEFDDVSDLEEIYNPEDDSIEPIPKRPAFENSSMYEFQGAKYLGFERLEPRINSMIEEDVDNMYVDEDRWPGWYNAYDILRGFIEWESNHLHTVGAAPPPYTP